MAVVFRLGLQTWREKKKKQKKQFQMCGFQSEWLHRKAGFRIIMVNAVLVGVVTEIPGGIC